MRKIPASAAKTPEPESTAQTSESPALTEAASALNAAAAALSQQAAALTKMMVESHKGRVSVQIERDSDGRMSNLVIEKIAEPGNRLN